MLDSLFSLQLSVYLGRSGSCITTQKSAPRTRVGNESAYLQQRRDRQVTPSLPQCLDCAVLRSEGCGFELRQTVAMRGIGNGGQIAMLASARAPSGRNGSAWGGDLHRPLCICTWLRTDDGVVSRG